jgi:hypothetical protein
MKDIMMNKNKMIFLKVKNLMNTYYKDIEEQ